MSFGICFLIDFQGVGRDLLVHLALKLEGRGPFYIEKHIVFNDFSYFRYLANRRPYDQFFGQHDPQLEPQNPSKFVSKSIQEPFKNQ